MAEVVTRPGRQQRISVLVADEYQMARDWLRCHLERAAGVAVVGVAEDGEEAQRLALALRPEVLLLNVALPVVSGLDVAAAVRRALPRTRLLLLAGRDGWRSREVAREMCADGFLEKTLTPQELLEAVRTVSAGRPYVQRAVAQRWLAREGERGQLTGREREVLRLVAEGCENAEIGRRLRVSHDTVKFHMKNLFVKLGATTRIEAMRQARRSGLLDEEFAATYPKM